MADDTDPPAPIRPATPAELSDVRCYYELLGQHELSGEAFARAAALNGGDNPQVLTDLSRVREKEGKTREAYEAIEAYVRGMESRGGAPAWARVRAPTLKEKAAAGSAK